MHISEISLLGSLKSSHLVLRNLPDANLTISVARVEGGAISRPAERDALGVVARLGLGEDGLQVINNGLGEQVPNLDGSGGGSAEPVAVGSKDKGVDDTASLQRVQVLGIIQVPKHDSGILTGTSAQGTIGGDGNSVNVAIVTNVVDAEDGGLRLHIPNLDHLVPTGRDQQGVSGIGREADGRDPLGVTTEGSVGTGTTTGSSGKVTTELTTSVPHLDGLVTATGDNHAVVRGEGNGHDIVSVTDKGGLTLAGGQVPQAHGLIPGTGEGEATVSRQGNILDKVIVTGETTLSQTIDIAVLQQVPNDSRLVYTEDKNDCSKGMDGPGLKGDYASQP